MADAPEPTLYRAVRWPLRLALRLYFGHVHVARAGLLPPRGPVVIAANHPQSLADAMVLSAAIPRPVHYLGHAGLFRPAWRGWLLRRFGVLPVYRSGEGNRTGARNDDTFAACHELLGRGGVIGIFPEGISQEEPVLQPLRTGAARIALGAEAAHGYGLGLVVLPCGLGFSSRRRFRSDVLVRLGEPMAVSAWHDRYAADAEAAVREFTAELSERIRDQVVHHERGELDQLAAAVERQYGERWLERADLGLRGDSEAERRHELRRQLARALDHFYAQDPALVARLERQLARLERRAKALRVAAADLGEEPSRDPATGWAMLWLRLLPWLLLALPAAFLAFPPYWFTQLIAGRLSPDLTRLHAHRILVGAALLPAWFALLAFVSRVHWGWAWWGVAALCLAVPLVALGARASGEALRRQREALRHAYLVSVRGAAWQRLRQDRRALDDEIGALVVRYAASRTTRD